MKKSGKKWIAFDFGQEKRENANVNGVKNQSFESIVIKKSFNFMKKIEPKTPSDLAVHPKKIKEVEQWLHKNVIDEQEELHYSILLITGPSGSGKTTTVNVLCKSMGIGISEWVNPMDQDYEFSRNSGQSAKFSEFLSDSKYPSLLDINSKKIVLVEDFPNSLIHNPSELGAILEKYYHTARIALVFISTDSSVGSLNLSQTLFPNELREKFCIDLITFNPCPPTFLKTALKRAQDVIRTNLDLFKVPSTGTEEAIICSSMGDIRSAVSQYHFASLKGTDDLPTEKLHNEPKSGTKRKRAPSKNAAVKHMIRDETLGLFHSLGRVLNPKRTTSSQNSWRLECNLDPLVDELNIQPMTTVPFLFENYLKYFGDLDDARKAAEVISSSQILFEKGGEKQECMFCGLYLIVFGLMVCNEHKVSKWNQLRGPRKVKKGGNIDLEIKTLSPTDYSYYDLITGTNRFNRFKQKSL